MAAIKKYNPDFHDPWAWSLASKGATDQEIADAMGISRKTINRWSWTTNDSGDKVLTSFGKSLHNGKDACDAQVEKSLFQKCIGYSYDEEEQVIEVDNKGSSKIGKITKRKKTVPPDTMAIMYWLNNRRRDEWGSGRNKTQESNNAVDDWVNSIPDVEVNEIETPKKE